MNASKRFKLTSPKEVRALLEHLGHRPNRGLGQNYLIDANILDIIAKTADIKPTDALLEIGPGLGALTERLLPQSNHVVAIEKDPTMVAHLKTRFPHLKLIEADALHVDLETLFLEGINKVAANLPYSVGTRLVIEMAECTHRPELLSLTLQKEVVDRMIAPVGTKQFGILAILTGLFYKSTLVKKISPTCFFPAPKVWSAVVKMQKHQEPIIQPNNYPSFKTLIKACFSQRRKQIGTLLRKQGFNQIESTLEQIKIHPTDRPECISIKQWVALHAALSKQ
jgi:16S rRNA (adenine1518-N6/adenine1519-N6)-dimethyltransferase